MSAVQEFHFVTVGTSDRLVRNLWSRISARGGMRLSHIVHPGFAPALWPAVAGSGDLYFLRKDLDQALPPADPRLLASLESADVPTIHNMILGDRYLAKLGYQQALQYATLLARRLQELYRQIRPSVIIGGFDGLHGSLALAVARREGIPWYCLMFASMPAGRAAFCSRLSPASAVIFEPQRTAELRGESAQLLEQFEARSMRAVAYIPPALGSPWRWLERLPGQLRSLGPILRRRRHREFLKYTDYEYSYSVTTQVREAIRHRSNLWRLRGTGLRTRPGEAPYAFFGLHTQPESSIDVWAHFFSNQLRVIELMSRSLPPTHRLLVKLHKSDAPNYSAAQLQRLRAFPGVELVAPQADSFELIRGAALVFSIQGTIGLEAALLGKPVISFGESPIRIFPSVSGIGPLSDLPELVRTKLAQPPPERAQIVNALAAYLTPFYPASLNDWAIAPTDGQIDGYVHLFKLLEKHVRQRTESSPTVLNSGIHSFR